MTVHRLIPQSVSGYQLDAEQSFWFVCQAEATENLMINPSFEFNDDSLGSLWQTFDSYMGTTAWEGQSLERTVTTPTKAVHTWSAYVQAPAAYPVMPIAVRIKQGVTQLKVKYYQIVRKDDWTRLEIPWNANANTTYTISIEIQASNGNIITDCWQVEAKPYATTYVDGDMGVYFPEDREEFRWTGVPHYSTSIRTVKTRMGGRFIPLSDFGFMTTSMQGFGKAPVEQSFQVALSGRYVPETMRYGQRELVIGGTIMAKTHAELMRLRHNLTRLFSPQYWGEWKPIRLRVQLDPDGAAYDILAYYADGMQGEIDNLYRQNWAISLVTLDPNWNGRVKFLTARKAEDPATYYVLSRDFDTGAWQKWTRDQTAGTTYAMDSDGTGNYYTAGTQTGFVHKLRPAGSSATTTVGGGLAGTSARDIAASKSGPLVIGVVGDFTASATAYRIDLYINGAWKKLTMPQPFLEYPWDPGGSNVITQTGIINCIEWYNNEFYIGGRFSHVNPGGSQLKSDLIAAYNPWTNKWRTIGVYPLRRGNDEYTSDPGFADSHQVTSIIYGGDGYMYISGKWLENTGFNSNSVVRYNIASNIIEDVKPALQMGSGFYGFYSMAVSPGGTLHGVGYDPAITKYLYPSGDTWVERSLEQEGSVTNKISIDFAPDGSLLVGGSLYQWGDMTPQPYSLLWQIAPQGSNPPFAPLDLIYDTTSPPSKSITTLKVMNRKAFIAIDGNGGSHVILGKQTTITNGGDEVTRIGMLAGQQITIYSIRNETTNKQIVLDSPIVVPTYGYIAIVENHGALYKINLAVQNERPVPIKFNRALSDLAALDLLPGDNTININYTLDDSFVGESFVFMNGVAAFWQERHSTL